jgi:hypothetical protein
LTPPGAGFTVSLPGTPGEVKQTINTPLGPVEAKMFVVANPSDKSGFLVGFNDYPAGVTQQGTPDQILDGARQGAVQNVPGAKLLAEKKVSVGDVPGREITMDLGTAGQGRFRFFLAGSRLYQLGVTGTGEKVTSADAERFFNSFRITGK